MAGSEQQQNEDEVGGEGTGNEGGQSHDDFGGASEQEIQEARSQGWKPKAELGDDKRWVNAKTFVERGRHFNTRLQKQVETLTAQVQAFEGTKKQVQKFYEDTLSRREKEHDDAIRDLRRQIVEATSIGDADTAIALEDRVAVINTQKAELKAEGAALKKDLEQPAKPAHGDVAGREDKWPAPLKEWVDDGNQWFRDDPKLAAYAVALGDELRAAGDTSKDREFLDKVKDLMVEQMPHKFQNGNRQRSGPSGGTGNGTTKGKTKADLPEADRKLLDQYVSEGWMTEDAFLKSYFGR